MGPTPNGVFGELTFSTHQSDIPWYFRDLQGSPGNISTCHNMSQPSFRPLYPDPSSLPIMATGTSSGISIPCLVNISCLGSRKLLHQVLATRDASTFMDSSDSTYTYKYAFDELVWHCTCNIMPTSPWKGTCVHGPSPMPRWKPSERNLGALFAHQSEDLQELQACGTYPPAKRQSPDFPWASIRSILHRSNERDMIPDIES